MVLDHPDILHHIVLQSKIDTDYNASQEQPLRSSLRRLSTSTRRLLDGLASAYRDARRSRDAILTVPPLVVTIAGITPFLPGLSVYRGLSALTSDQTGIGLGLMFQALAIAVALAAGIVFGEWVTRNLRRSAAADG